MMIKLLISLPPKRTKSCNGKNSEIFALNSAEPIVDDSLVKNENIGCSNSLVEMQRTTLPTSEQNRAHLSLRLLDLLDLLTVKVVHKLSHVRHVVDDQLGPRRRFVDLWYKC